MVKDKNYLTVLNFMNDIKNKENRTIEEEYILGLQEIVNLTRLKILCTIEDGEYYNMSPESVRMIDDNIKCIFEKLFGDIDTSYAYKKEDNRSTFAVELLDVTKDEKILGSVCLKADCSLDALSQAEIYFSKANDLNIVDGNYFLCELDKTNKFYPSKFLHIASSIISPLDDIYKLRVVDIN